MSDEIDTERLPVPLPRRARPQTEAQRLEDIEALIRRGKRFLWAAVAAAGASLGGAATMALQRAEAHGADQQRMHDIEENLRQLKDDVREMIRAQLHRTSDGSTPESEAIVPRDRMSFAPFAAPCVADASVVRHHWWEDLACPEGAAAAEPRQSRALEIRVAGPPAHGSGLGRDGRLTPAADDREDKNGHHDAAHAQVLPW